MTIDDEYLTTLAFQLGEYLLAGQRSVTTAESCTGGWIAKTFTDIPGSSAWFGAGYVTYSYEAKVRMLGVDQQKLEREGAVSLSVAREMALGALERSAAHLAVAVSGIAGPDGATDNKPVGTVCFAWAYADNGGAQCDARIEVFSGDRAAIRRQSVATAIEGLIALAAMD